MMSRISAHQLGLELFFLRMVQAKVGEHIPAAALDGDFAGHVLVPSRALAGLVMPGLDPGIHQSSRKAFFKMMDCRVKPGNDEFSHDPAFIR